MTHQHARTHTHTLCPRHDDALTSSSSRFHSFLLFLGQPSSSVRDVKVTNFCRIISEFALEYRTTRERVLTIKRKRAVHRERTKTRGKMITEVRPSPACQRSAATESQSELLDLSQCQSVNTVLYIEYQIFVLIRERHQSPQTSSFPGL